MYADYAVHAHDSLCYDESGALVCALPEVKTHKHSESCYQTSESNQVHSHSDACYDRHQELVCTEEVSNGASGEGDSEQAGDAHAHGDDCYVWVEELACGLEEGEADAELAEPELICAKQEVVLHSHTDACRDANGSYICGMLEVVEHTHSDECFESAGTAVGGESVPICGLEEHSHDESCLVTTEVRNELEDAADFGDQGAAVYPDGSLLDISNGPVVVIFALEKSAASEQSVEEESAEPARARFAAEPSARAAKNAETNIKDYAEANNGSMSVVLSDLDDVELPTDASGNYILTAETTYKLSLGIELPRGIPPGTYYYQLPEGLSVIGGSGKCVTRGTNIELGTWTVSDNGLITFELNENANSQTGVQITATMGASFSHSEYPIKFDGSVSVIVNRPPEQDLVTELSKWGGQGDESKGQDPNKLYWQVIIEGHENSRIVGTVLSDALVAGSHSYTQSDMANGIRINASYHGTGEPVNVSWVVKQGDPNLTWTSTGWSYTMPKSVVSGGRTVALGNNNWRYFIEYTSTMAEEDSLGAQSYSNQVKVDGEDHVGFVVVQDAESGAGVSKNGFYQGGSNGGKFMWTVTITVPGGKADRSWWFRDTLQLMDANWSLMQVYFENNIDDPDTTEVHALHDGVFATAPNVKYATEDHEFAWVCNWTQVHDGVEAARQIVLLNRCTCDAENCMAWGANGCGGRIQYADEDGSTHTSDHCRCWNVEGDTVFTFEYETPGAGIVGSYGGNGDRLFNGVELIYSDTGAWDYNYFTSASAEPLIPGVFEKELTSKYDGYIASYSITVNEAMVELTTGGAPLLIHDVMTETLAYISGSLTITAKDAAGNVEQLKQGDDFSVTYDGSGDKKDADGNPAHVLDIVIHNPKPVMYTLDYDATLVMPDMGTDKLKYKNSASIELFGKTITVDTEEKIYADINIVAENYRVSILKTDASTGAALPGATFGLYNQAGGLIASGTTDEDGSLMFETNVIEGIIFQNHVPYYIQEISAPEGYYLSDTRHWFCFCKEPTGVCTYNSGISDLKVISDDETSDNEIDFDITNSRASYELPATGGSGVSAYMVNGAALITASALLLLIKLSKRRRRGV